MTRRFLTLSKESREPPKAPPLAIFWGAQPHCAHRRGVGGIESEGRLARDYVLIRKLRPILAAMALPSDPICSLWCLWTDDTSSMGASWPLPGLVTRALYFCEEILACQEECFLDRKCFCYLILLNPAAVWLIDLVLRRHTCL